MNFRRTLQAGSACAAMLTAASLAQAGVVFTYNDFSSTAGLTLVGSTSTPTTSDGAVLRLTPAAGGQSGAAYSTAAVTLGANATFSTQFQFRITQPGGIDPADGFTFVVSASSTGLGSSGGGIGYGGVPNSAAIEFDTFNNGSVDNNSSNHVGLDIAGNIFSAISSSPYGVTTCDFGAGTIYTAAGCLANGDLWTANVSYDGTSLNVSVTDPAIGTTFNAISNYAIDLAAVLGTNNAFVGFTSGTGSGFANHDIVNWSFANTTELAQSNTPEPASMALMGSGLLALAAIVRKRRR